MASTLSARERHSGERLARSAAFAAIGQLVPMVVAVATIPLIVRGLGAAAFGVFQLAWVVLGYFALLDLGLGRATNRFVSQALGRADPGGVHAAVRAAIRLQAVMGVIGGALMAALVPTLVERTFNIPPALQPTSSQAFYLLAALVPVVLLSTAFGGVLQAYQRFDVLGSIQAAVGVGGYVLPVIALAFGGDLVLVVGVVALTRLLSLGALAWSARRALGATTVTQTHRLPYRPLLAYGGWIAVSNLVTPLMVYLDRAFIGSLLTVTAVAYYSAPYDVIMRLSVVPAAITGPVFSAAAAEGDGGSARVRTLFVRGVRYITLLMAPAAVAGIVIAAPGLAAWLGPEFAAEGSWVARILLVAVTINALAQLPYGTLQAVGRADVTARNHLIELPVFVLVLWIGIRQWGIVGAALASLIRITLDAVLLFASARRVHALSLRAVTAEAVAPFGWAAVATLLLAAATMGMTSTVVLRLLGAAGSAGLFLLLGWRALPTGERATIRGLVGR